MLVSHDYEGQLPLFQNRNKLSIRHCQNDDVHLGRVFGQPLILPASASILVIQLVNHHGPEVARSLADAMAATDAHR